MKKSRVLMILAACVLLFVALACKKSENTTSTTDTSTTTTSATDTTVTTSTNDTSGTSGTSGTPGTVTTGTTATTLSKDDQDFMTKAAQGGLAEVSLGSLAAQKGMSADLKSFANRMVNDHGKANDELKQLAQNKNFTLPTDMDADSKKTQDELNGKNGKDFDKAYMDAMVKDHEKDVKAFEKESKDAKDPDLKNWVSKTLPTLQDHLKMAKETQKKVK